MKHILEASREFAARYTRVFRSAWAARRELEPPPQTADELAFLPAHLELIETPISPLPSWTMRLLMGLIATALIWACIGELDIVAVAPGKVVAGSRTKVIQSAETAVVSGIHVRDGQSVKKGQVLIELDRSATAADYARAGEALIAARLAELRFQAMADALSSGVAPVLAPANGLPPARHASEQALARSQFDMFKARRDSLSSAIAQRRAELATARGMVEPLAETARIAATRSADYAKLLEGNYVGRHDYLLRDQERIAAERDLAAQKSRVTELRSGLAEAQEQLHVLRTEAVQQTLDQLRQAREQVGLFAPELAKADSRNRLMQLRAPVDGTVQQLAIHTRGGVVTPAQVLLAVVPSADDLEVEATVLNKDIGFVRVGQRVSVKIESFPYTRYGYIEGRVLAVSRDAAQDDQLGLVFPARVGLDRATLRIGSTDVRITPGMALSVEIKTARRALIDFVLSPLERHRGESFRER